MNNSRRVSRIFALQALFANEFLHQNSEALIIHTSLIIEGLAQDDFAKELIIKVIENQKNLDLTLQKKITNWKLHRLSYIDLSILRLGEWEISYGLDKKIVINEYIEIAKEFSNTESFSFINGILDSKI